MPDVSERLRDELLGIDPLRLRATRDHLLVQLEQSHKGLAVPQTDDARADLAAIAAACLTRPGALRDLIDQVRRFAPAHPALDRLARMADVLFPDEWLTGGERARLLAGLTGIDRAVLVAAFRDTVPLDANLPGDGSTADLTTRLESLVGVDDEAPPLLAFLARVAKRLDVVGAARLRQWTDEVAARLGLAPGLLDWRPAPDAAPVDPTTYLTVIVRPDALTDDRYLLSVWVQHGNRAEHPLLIDDHLRTVGEVATALRVALRGAARETDDPLTIEMVLPRALITEPVDQWTAGDAPGSREELGARHTVVLRSLDRLRRLPRERDAWRQRWARLNRAAERERTVQVSAPAGPRQWRADRAGDGTRGPLVLALDGPLPAARSLQNDAFTAALTAGVPVLVWSRHAGLGPTMLDTVLAVAGRFGPGRLPAEVRRIRMLAGVGDDLGRHLSLVWDDADRIPAEFRAPPLRAPQR
ncbi:effector-associated domain 2-containing protein [Dactylosporangium sp. CS-047395]|uniref:VMAP-C domain-containing protein n=1 Tax=Dactylosporangium sp. CS-047395 TaxID=3239936 RepID=UPI003D8FBCE9